MPTEADELLRQFMIVAFETLQENQRTIAMLSNNLAALEDLLRETNPNLARIYAERGNAYKKHSAPFDEGVMMQRFDDLIRKLKEGKSL